VIRILLVDDHASFREPLAYMLGLEPDICIIGQAGTLAEARSLLSLAHIAIIDLDLPDGDGVDLITEFARDSPDGAALVLTASGAPIDLARAANAGAAAILRKSCPFAEVLRTIRRLAAGEPIIPPDELATLLELANQHRAQANDERQRLASLTPRERDVLRGLAAGLSDKEIARTLHIGRETVRTHLVNLMAKLGVNSRLQALVFALRHNAVDLD
jgi:DNA-binding NarL/FixJ family response regulator